jgi:hypothetical protein
MADQSDVENALVNLVSVALYPNGTDEASVCGRDCRVYRGWPNSAALDTDLAAGRINITVFPGSGAGRTTTRYAERWVGTPAQPALIAAATGTSVTFSGRADTGQVAGLLVDGRSYAYRIQAGDTPELVAANLASMAREYSIVRLSRSTLTIAGAGNLLARVVTDATAQQEVRRQEQEFRVTCWCPTPASRDTAAAAIDKSLSSERFLPLPDATQGRLIYSGTTVFDEAQNASLYRRDLMYSVEYATTLSASQPAMLFGDLGFNTVRLTA